MLGAARAPRSVASSRTAHPLRLVVAEDDAEMRRLLHQGLSRDGHQVTIAEDGPSAAQLIEAGAADVAVLDVRMPGLSGLDVLRAVRARGARVEVILITGFGDAGVHDEALRLGALHVLDKPFDLDDLRELVETVAASLSDGRPRAS